MQSVSTKDGKEVENWPGHEDHNEYLGVPETGNENADENAGEIADEPLEVIREPVNEAGVINVRSFAMGKDIVNQTMDVEPRVPSKVFTAVKAIEQQQVGAIKTKGKAKSVEKDVDTLASRSREASLKRKPNTDDLQSAMRSLRLGSIRESDRKNGSIRKEQENVGDGVPESPFWVAEKSERRNGVDLERLTRQQPRMLHELQAEQSANLKGKGKASTLSTSDSNYYDNLPLKYDLRSLLEPESPVNFRMSPFFSDTEDLRDAMDFYSFLSEAFDSDDQAVNDKSDTLQINVDAAPAERSSNSLRGLITEARKGFLGYFSRQKA